MLRSLFRADRRNSKAHLLLLSKFLDPQAPEKFLKSESWQEVLKEPPQKAIKRFLKDGLIAEADLSDHLAYKFKVSDLKEFLKQHGLPVSGRKQDLIGRLIQADPEGMQKAVAGLAVCRCTERGQQVAEQYLSSEKEERIQVEQSVRDAICRREFREASQLVATFEAKQVFSRGMNIEWGNYDSKRDVAILKNIFTRVPKALSRIKSESLEELRVATALKYLWGRGNGTQWISSDLATGLAVDAAAAINMLDSHAVYLCNIADFKRSGVVEAISITTVNDPLVCSECQELARKTYRLDEVPELPYEKCSCESGCRCFIRPVVSVPMLD